MASDETRGRGRPTEYDPSKNDEVRKLCESGATMDQVADFLGVSTVTVWTWRHRYADFLNAVRLGREFADERVERALYERATGYRRKAVKILQDEGRVIEHEYIEEVTPDVTAQKFWLTNRLKGQWRDRHEVAHDVIDNLADELRAARERAVNREP